MMETPVRLQSLCFTRTLHLRQNLRHHIPADVRQPEMAALELVGQLLVVDAQAVQDRGVQVVDVDRVVDDVVAEVVGLAVGDARA